MPKEKTLDEKLEEASAAVERALEARDKAIQDLMKAKMAYGEVWRNLHDKSQAPVPDEKEEKTAPREVQRAEAEPPTDGANPALEEKRS
jgi:hypothetical protein